MPKMLPGQVSYILKGLVLILGLFPYAVTVDVGFDLLFTTNKRTLQDYPVYFDDPIPSWLKGNYIRNGLGRFEMGSRNFTHAFDAYAKLASWKLDGKQKVLFTSKFVRTRAYKKSKALRDIAPFLLFDATVPKFNFFQRMESIYRGIDNTNVNVHRFGQTDKESRYLALSDFWQNYEFDPSSLRTRKQINAKIPAGEFYNEPFPLPSSSHPIKEEGTSNFINFLTILNPLPLMQSTINIIRIKNAEVRELIATIPVPEVPYMHSFGLSKRYAIIFADPLFVNPFKMVKSGQAVRSLDWKPEVGSSIYVTNINTGNYTRFASSSVFNMHHVNSYEDGDMLLVDFITYPDISFLASLELNALRDPVLRNQIAADACLRRYTFDMKMKTLEYVDFRPTITREFVNRLDMPAINMNYQFNHYCYVYGIVTKSDDVHLSNVTLGRKDICQEGRDMFWYEENHYPSEPWFVPNPEGTEEDDGVLLSVILDGVKGKSYLGMFDPKTMEKINVAYLPIPIPFSLHGRLFDEE